MQEVDQLVKASKSTSGSLEAQVAGLWKQAAFERSYVADWIPNTNFYLLRQSDKLLIRDYNRPTTNLAYFEVHELSSGSSHYRWLAKEESDVLRTSQPPWYLVVYQQGHSIYFVDLRRIYEETQEVVELPAIRKDLSELLYDAGRTYPENEFEDDCDEFKTSALSSTKYLFEAKFERLDKPVVRFLACFVVDTSDWPTIDEKDRKLENIIINKIDLSFDIDSCLFDSDFRWTYEHHEETERYVAYKVSDGSVEELSISADLKELKRISALSPEDCTGLCAASAKKPYYFDGRFLQTYHETSTGQHSIKVSA